MRQFNFTNPKVAKMLASIQNQVVEAQSNLNDCVKKLQTQGNYSNLPGLSNPTAAASGAAIGGFPSLGGTGGQAGTTAASGASNPYQTSSSAYGGTSAGQAK